MERKTIRVLLEQGLFTERLVHLLMELNHGYRVLVDPTRRPLDLERSELQGAALTVLDVDRLGPAAEDEIRAAIARAPGARIAGLTNDEGRAQVDRLMQAGLVGYIPKRFGGAETLVALAVVLAGSDFRPVPGTNVSVRYMTDMPLAHSRTVQSFGLTEAESRVLSLLARGKTNREIALIRGTKPSTVRIQLTPIFRKLGVQSRGQAIVIALRHGLIDAHQAEGRPEPLDLAWLIPHMKYRRHPRGHVIFHKGEVGTEMFLIQRGRVTISEVDVELKEHDVFGEVSVFASDHRRTNSATCSTDVDLWALPEDKARHLCVTDPAFALRMLSLVATRLSADARRAA